MLFKLFSFKNSNNILYTENKNEKVLFLFELYANNNSTNLVFLIVPSYSLHAIPVNRRPLERIRVNAVTDDAWAKKLTKKKKVDRQIVVLKYCKTTDDGDYEIRPQQSSLSDVTLVA